MMARVITLLTDFGTADGYVGEIKGVLATAAPGATIVDITHDIPAHDVDLGRLTVARYWRRFPAETIHVAVVDPGVGSSRAALAVMSDGRYLIGPDNGLLSPALLMPDVRVVELSVPAHSSTTFHGRDVFAPAAASIANGATLDDLGEPAAAPIVHRTPEPHRDANGEIVGQIIAVDRFGNAITNLIATRFGRLRIGQTAVPMRRTYAELGVGEAGAIVGSSGLIEIAVREGSAASSLGLKRGDAVVLTPVSLPRPAGEPQRRR